MVNQTSDVGLSPVEDLYDRNEAGSSRINGGDRTELRAGMRVGRFLVVRDVDGSLFAVAAAAASVLSSTDDGTLLMLSGGRALHVPEEMATVLAWLDGRS